jgi:hypothetical protein
MILGFVLVLIGIQLYLIQSYELTPRFSNFLSEHGHVAQAPSIQQATNNSPYYQASYPNANYNQPIASITAGNLRTITPPVWLCWPVLFLGAVVFLHGVAKPRN